MLENPSILKYWLISTSDNLWGADNQQERVVKEVSYETPFDVDA